VSIKGEFEGDINGDISDEFNGDNNGEFEGGINGEFNGCLFRATVPSPYQYNATFLLSLHIVE